MKKLLLIFSLIVITINSSIYASGKNNENNTLGSVIILKEGFESGAMPPTGWSTISTHATFTWQIKLGNQFDLPYMGSYLASISNNPFNNPQNEWLISPFFDLTETDSAFLSFAFKTNYNSHVTDNKVDVWLKISTDSGNTWSNLWREEDFGVFNSIDWFVDTIDLKNYLNKCNLKIAFNYVGAEGAFFKLDEITIAKVDIVPVEFTSFTASVINNDVNLSWITASEINNKGFEIYKRKINKTDWQMIGFISGNGTTSEKKLYSFIDKNINEPGNYLYRLKQIDYDGTFEYTNEVAAEISAPSEYSLKQNYPNPFNPSTKIDFTLSSDARVELKIFNILGEELLTLIKGDYAAGNHSVDFNPAGFNSGVYFYGITVQGIDGSEFSSVKKMIFNK